ncbi:hypothetical protein CAC42_1884 [Sphaceloma murrayae]|uniref:Uncharacterized protein n=1 Tax=Sphaceloma murrayae TaxID=2082308 RepID=A0A2K1QVR4_9PEZI|nr:hypothetical protein CAC42_1884 [Sphaceloma murrayae]
MSSTVSRAKPATAQELDESTDTPVPGTKVSAGSADKQPSSQTEMPHHHTRRKTEATSDSGRSNHTYETLASTDSAKVMPRVPDLPKEKSATPAATAAAAAAAPVLPPPEKTKTTSPKKSSRTSSPGKKPRRAESKSSKKSAEPHPAAYPPGYPIGYVPCDCPDCMYQAAHYAHAAPVHPAVSYPSPYPMEAPPEHYYPPSDPAIHDYPPELRPKLRRTSRPRPYSFHTAPPADPRAITAHAHHLAGYDLEPYYDDIDRRDYLDRPVVEGAVDVLPTIRQSPLVTQRPTMHHAHTDHPRRSAYKDYAPVFPDETDVMPHSSSYGRQHGFPSAVDHYFRHSSRSPTRQAAAAYPRRLSRDEVSYPPVSMGIGRRSSLKHSNTIPDALPVRASSRSRRDRSYTDLDSARAMYGPDAYLDPEHARRSSRNGSHSRRHSQQVPLSRYDLSDPHSRSPGHRYTTSESRTQRPISYYSHEEQAKQTKRRSRDMHYEAAAYDKFAEVRKYQSAVTGRNDEDELTRSLHRGYSKSGVKPILRQSSLRSGHSGRSRQSHHSGRPSLDAGSSSRESDIQVQVKVIRDGQTISKSKIAGSTDISITETGEIWHKDRSYHGSSAKSTASVFSSLFGKNRRGSGGRSGNDTGNDGARESRRRSRVASPIIEDRRGERESRRY